MPGPADGTLARLTARVAKKLCQRGHLMVTAESCTGGFLAKTLTDRPGSSECYDRGWVTYSNNAKHSQLGVRMKDIHRHGAVSRTVALVSTVMQARSWSALTSSDFITSSCSILPSSSEATA